MGRRWIDYKALKADVSFTDVLEYYGVELKVNGEQAKGKCPLPNHQCDEKSKSLSVNLGRNVFQCFGCGAKGNVLEFVAMMEGMNPQDSRAFHKAALLVEERFQFKDARSVNRPPEKPKRGKSDRPKVLVNPPLDFSLKELEPDHPNLKMLGLERETIAHFGLGYCSRGMFKGRIAIPLHDADGQLVGYAGLLVDDSLVNDKNPKYLFPAERRERQGTTIEFRKDLILYNGHRIDGPVEELVVVQDFLGVWHLWQLGIRNVVALMGNVRSAEQAKQIVEATEESGRVRVIPDGGELGEKCAGSLIFHVSQQRFVRWDRLSRSKTLGSLSCDELTGLELNRL